MSHQERARYVASLLDAARLAHEIEDARPRPALWPAPILTDEQMAAVDETWSDL